MAPGKQNTRHNKMSGILMKKFQMIDQIILTIRIKFVRLE